MPKYSVTWSETVDFEVIVDAECGQQAYDEAFNSDYYGEAEQSSTFDIDSVEVREVN